jgi:hypothetical protein
MAREIEVVVPLPRDQALTLLLQAAETLQHRVVHFEAAEGRAEIHVDFSLRALSTFRVHAEAHAHGNSETRLRLTVSPSFKLGIFTGVGQSQHVGWQLVGKMQEIMDPERYEALEDNVLPPRRSRVGGTPTPPGP